MHAIFARVSDMDATASAAAVAAAPHTSIPTETRRNVLIPIDASPNCERAMKWYVDNLKRPDDFVFFIHVIEPVYSSPALGLAMESPPQMVDEMTRVMEENIIAGKKLGQRYMRMAKEAKLAHKAFLHVDTKPGHAIIRSVAEHKVNLIVIASRGLGVLKRTFLGSISDYVVHNTHVPVAIVPPKLPAPSTEKPPK